MLTPRQKAEIVARKYMGIAQLPKVLGFGSEGFVFPTMRSTAVKVFTYEEKFINELTVYQRLRARGVSSIQEFAIPKLVNADQSLMVIEIGIVQPPFLVDFSQAQIDQPPDFPEGLDEWWERLELVFGDRLTKVQSVFWELVERTGIYYYDLAPRNMNFGDDE